MIQLGPYSFRQVWIVDFEFHAPQGELPIPLCAVGREVATGRVVRRWLPPGGKLTRPPFPTDRDILLVAYYASAEVGCFLALGWPVPVNWIDLYAEFRNATNGTRLPCGSGLLGAMAYYGIPGIESLEKKEMRDLALRGGPYTAAEQGALLDYCQSDVDALHDLFVRMQERIDVPRALLRGRYMTAAAHIEGNGIPLDVETLGRLRARWSSIKAQLTREVDKRYEVYDEGVFRLEKFRAWLSRANIPWPTLESGRLALDDDTFRERARAYPVLSPLRELRSTLSRMRLEDLAVGSDGRNRCLLSAFRARTGRNQPSNSKFIFGPSAWLRSLIRPEPGTGLAYVDWDQQEFGIAAELSRDSAMVGAYDSGDPYMTFAIQAGAAPGGATKATHRGVRELYKTTALATQYGMGARSLGQKLGIPESDARELLRGHRRTYRDYWKFSDAAVDHAMLYGAISTTFGWTLHVTDKANPRSLRNFPLQANGAEMLRIACILATEAGVRVAAPVHDALLIEADEVNLDDAVHVTRASMAEASRTVLDGFELRTDVNVIRHPDRYVDERGREMWGIVMGLLDA